jgi:hypothetical protein
MPEPTSSFDSGPSPYLDMGSLPGNCGQRPTVARIEDETFLRFLCMILYMIMSFIGYCGTVSARVREGER